MATIIDNKMLNMDLRQEIAILYSRLDTLESNVDMWQKRALNAENIIIVLEKRLNAAPGGSMSAEEYEKEYLRQENEAEEEYLREEREVEAWTKAEAAKAEEEAIQEQWEQQCGKEESAEEQWERYCSEEL
jgi:hypothetical protein